MDCGLIIFVRNLKIPAIVVSSTSTTLRSYYTLVTFSLNGNFGNTGWLLPSKPPFLLLEHVQKSAPGVHRVVVSKEIQNTHLWIKKLSTTRNPGKIGIWGFKFWMKMWHLIKDQYWSLLLCPRFFYWPCIGSKQIWANTKIFWSGSNNFCLRPKMIFWPKYVQSLYFWSLVGVRQLWFLNNW